MGEMQKTYSPQDIETSQYHIWESEGFFQPKGEGPTFSIVIPPPNVTGALHLGHALEQTLIDILVRMRRMRGERVLWLPGTDHAGIATQNVVEREIAKSDQSRHDMGREAFVDRVWEWKEEYGNRITTQMRRLGISIDWSRERFTMDPGCAEAVLETFIRLHDRGLIYRGAYIINWCPRCTTALSDIEVEHEEAQGALWHIEYKGTDGNITVATTRPETMFGDQAIAVHPDDSRYTYLIGKTVQIPLTDRWIPILADSAIDPTFGTGAVKVTPAHDPNDFEMGKRHNLEQLLIMDVHGVMNNNVPEQFRGQDRMACRKSLVAALTETGHLLATHAHTLSRGQCYRCKTIIEPYLSKQWFVKMSSLAEDAIRVVKEGEISFVPSRYEKLYFDWMENIREWCISRQIWWGHRIPVWYPTDAPDTYVVSREMPQDGRSYTQDPDVLDTWFSSALWPFSTMGWPDTTAPDMAFYPTTMLVTGYDILTFWVSRMITMGLALTEKSPFSTVYIHGLVRDSNGKKMSKSSGNVVDPLVMIDKYGADALRFSLASLSTLGGQDIRFSEERVESARNFANKIWNASRFVLMTLEQTESVVFFEWPAPQTAADQWLLQRYTATLETVTHCFETYNYALATESLWEFFWNVTCDWYLEMSKQDKTRSLPMLIMAVLKSIQLLHPYMPFITEEIWKRFAESGRISGMPEASVMRSPWPTLAEIPAFDSHVADCFSGVIDAIRVIRNIRQQAVISPGVALPVSLQGPAERIADLVAEQGHLLRLAKVSALHILPEEATSPKGASSAAVGALVLHVHIGDAIDKDAERQRLTKEIDKLAVAVMGLKTRLSDPGFLGKAPAVVVEKNQAQLRQLEDELAAFQVQRENL